MAVTASERKPWHAIFRLLERDERVFAVLLAVVMVGGLATFGLVPLRPRHRIDLYSLVFWFAAYKVGIFALVTVNPRATRAIFVGALAIDLFLVFVLQSLTGGAESLFYHLFQLLVAERMATVGRLSLKVAHEVRNPISAIEVNAEMLEDIVRARSDADMKEAVGLVTAIRDQVTALDALTEEYLAFARFPRPHFEEESVNHLVQELADFVRPVASRQGLTLRVEVDPNVPMMEIDRGLLRQAVWNLVKNGLEALSSGGELTIASHFDGEGVEIAVSDTGEGIPDDVGPQLFEQFFTTKPQGTGLGLSITRQIAEEHGGEVRWANRVGRGATFTIRLPIKRVTAHA